MAKLSAFQQDVRAAMRQALETHIPQGGVPVAEICTEAIRFAALTIGTLMRTDMDPNLHERFMINLMNSFEREVWRHIQSVPNDIAPSDFEEPPAEKP